MRILIAAPEAVPYAKIGGLGDVAGALPSVLTRMGHEVRLVMPYYRMIDYVKHGLHPLIESMDVPTGIGPQGCMVHHQQPPEGFDAFFIERNDLFDREGIYGYNDDGWRFAFFCNAVLQLCRETQWSPDVIHVHDWPTALIPALLKYNCENDPILCDTGSVLTIHNCAHHGKCKHEIMGYAGLPPEAFNERIFEDWGGVNLLKGGVAMADLINAVSPTYAREILSPVGGMGMDPYLQYRHADLHGILNGVDYDVWSPEADELIPAKFDAEDLSGKAQCKAALQATFGLDQDPNAPILGTVARLTAQKGLELVAKAMRGIVEAGGQVVLLGSGDPELEETFRHAPSAFPGRVGTHIAYDNTVAHCIEAGADMYLMPSLFEPCGLNQIYSLRYGTIPIVRATGGLDDTIVQYDGSTGEGTGFKFGDISVDAFLSAVYFAIDVYRKRPEHWAHLVQQAMAQRFTWESSAEGYLQLYGWAVEKRKYWRM